MERKRSPRLLNVKEEEDAVRKEGSLIGPLDGLTATVKHVIECHMQLPATCSEVNAVDNERMQLTSLEHVEAVAASIEKVTSGPTEGSGARLINDGHHPGS